MSWFCRPDPKTSVKQKRRCGTTKKNKKNGLVHSLRCPNDHNMSLERGGDQATASETPSAPGQGSMIRETGALPPPQRQQQLLLNQQNQQQQQVLPIQATALPLPRRPLPALASSGALLLQEVSPKSIVGGF